MVLCAKIGKCTCTLLRAEKPGLHPTLAGYTGIGDAETPSPGMLREPVDLPYVCPRPKKLKRLATRDTLHGSRPNLRQRDPNGRIVPTPSDVSDKGANRKRKKMTIIRTHIILQIIGGKLDRRQALFKLDLKLKLYSRTTNVEVIHNNLV